MGVAVPTATIATPATTAAMPHSTTKRAPRRTTSVPATEIPTMEPTESPAMMSPICAVLASIASRMAGVRETHVAMQRPVMKKAANRAARLRWAVTVGLTAGSGQGEQGREKGPGRGGNRRRRRPVTRQ